MENPQTSTCQAGVNLVKNAFLKAFLSGFKKEVHGYFQ